MRSPAATAAASGLRYTSAAPSARTNPLARASKAKQWPVGEIIPALLKPILVCGLIKALTPPASAPAHCPDQMLSHAAATATSAEEQAVSMDRLGPLRSSMYETRLDAMLAVAPLFVYASTSSGLRS